VDWVYLAQGSDERWAVLRLATNCWGFLTRRGIPRLLSVVTWLVLALQDSLLPYHGAAPPDADCFRCCAVVVHTRDARRIHIWHFMAIRVIIGFIFLLYRAVEGICESGCNSTHSDGH
jgi:hypothetical protein